MAKERVSLKLNELSEGITTFQIDGTGREKSGLTKTLRTALNRASPGDKHLACYHLLGAIFEVSQRIIGDPDSGVHVLAWPMVHPALLSVPTTYTAQLALTLNAIYVAAKERGPLAGENSGLAAASIFPSASGNLPFWKNLLSQTMPQSTDDQSLPQYLSALLTAVEAANDPETPLRLAAGLFPLMESVVVRLKAALGIQSLVLIGFGSTVPTDRDRRLVELCHLRNLLLCDEQMVKHEQDSPLMFNLYLRTGYQLVAPALLHMAMRCAPSQPMMMSGLSGLMGGIGGMLGPFLQGTDASPERDEQE